MSATIKICFYFEDANGDKSMKVKHVIIWGGTDRDAILDTVTATSSANIK